MNRSRIVISLLLSMSLFACASSSDDASPPAETTDNAAQLATTEESADSAPEPGSPDEVICRSERLTGSNFSRRVCLTRAQRASMRSGSRDEFVERRSATIGR